MKRKFFFAFSIAAALLVLDTGVAYSQDKKEEKGQTCEEFVAKPLTDEQLKKLSEKDRKEYESEFKRCKEAIAGNEKAKNANAIVSRVLKEGAAAMGEKNYDVAIAKYDEGYNADTEFWGSAPVMLRNKAVALRARGIDKFNSANKNPDKAARAAGVVEAGKDFQAAVDATQKALDVLSKSPVPAGATEAKNFETNKFGAISDRLESYRLLLKADPTKAEAAVPAIQEYLAVEQDVVKKQKAQETLASAYFTAGNLDAAVIEYQKILAVQPGNSDALYFIGTALIATGEDAKIKEGVKHLENLVKSAPSDYDQTKIADAKGLIDVSTQKEPSKPASSRRKN